ncbi:hypothetical protein ACLOJK_029256, partial [Asimina triloba]
LLARDKTAWSEWNGSAWSTVWVALPSELLLLAALYSHRTLSIRLCSLSIDGNLNACKFFSPPPLGIFLSVVLYLLSTPGVLMICNARSLYRRASDHPSRGIDHDHMVCLGGMVASGSRLGK